MSSESDYGGLCHCGGAGSFPSLVKWVEESGVVVAAAEVSAVAQILLGISSVDCGSAAIGM